MGPRLSSSVMKHAESLPKEGDLSSTYDLALALRGCEDRVGTLGGQLKGLKGMCDRGLQPVKSGH